MASWKEYLFTKRKFSWGKKIYLRQTTFFKILGHGNVRDSACHPSWSQIQFLTRMGSEVLGRFYKQESFYPISGFAKCFSWFVPHISLMWLFAVQDFHFWYLFGPPPHSPFSKEIPCKEEGGWQQRMQFGTSNFLAKTRLRATLCHHFKFWHQEGNWSFIPRLNSPGIIARFIF